MKVQFDLVDYDVWKGSDVPGQIVVDLPTIPQVDDIINWPGLSQADTYVRTVVWYISHDDDGNTLDEPFVYVVVGRSRSDSIAAKLKSYLNAETGKINQHTERTFGAQH